jgi:hypothetical protein
MGKVIQMRRRKAYVTEDPSYIELVESANREECLALDCELAAQFLSQLESLEPTTDLVVIMDVNTLAGEYELTFPTGGVIESMKSGLAVALEQELDGAQLYIVTAILTGEGTTEIETIIVYLG